MELSENSNYDYKQVIITDLALPIDDTLFFDNSEDNDSDLHV